MLLRSSSTPVLGSLLSSFSDGGPSLHGHHEAPAAVPAAVHKAAALHNHHNFSFHPKGSPNFSTLSCNSSPISPSVHDLGGDARGHRKGGGFRRAQSEGNLEGLAQAYNMSPLGNSEDQFHTASHAKKSSARPRSMMLETIPSFSFDRYGHSREDEDEEGSDFDFDEREEYDEAPLVESSVMSRGSKSMSLIAEEEASGVGSVDMIEKSGFQENKERVRQEMYLAIGLDGSGVGDWGGDGGSRGGMGSNSSDDGTDGGNNQGIEEYYKKMVEESPNDSLFLRNYAQFLYQTQGDLERAEEYYARAILVDPRDGEILSQYAKLVWELHRDQPRASTYFERAVQASPEDSHVHAAYASFLWEVDDDEGQGEDEDEYEASLATYAMPPQIRGWATASVGA